MAGCSHMRLFIAGATTSGAVRASAALVSRLSASPAASLASVLAEAGATTKASQRRTSSRCEIGSWSGAGSPGKAPRAGSALELVDQHRRAGDALEGRAADEVQARGRLDHAHGVARLGGQPHQLDGLVGGDPAGDAEKDPGHSTAS